MIDLWHSALSRWKSTFFFFICGHFLVISPFKHTTIMLYNICYWWFFLSQSNWWPKFLVHPKICRTKPCLLMFASLVTLDSFHLLLSSQLTTDLTPKWSGGSIVTYLCKKSFVALKQLQKTLWSFWCVLGQLLNLGNLSIQLHLCLYDRVKSQNITS